MSDANKYIISERQKRRIVAQEVESILLNFTDIVGGTSSSTTSIINVATPAITNNEINAVVIDQINSDESNISSDSQELLNVSTNSLNNFSSAVLTNSDNNVSSIATINSNNENKNRAEIMFLRQWSLKNNVTHNALTELLHWFHDKPNFNDLPLDARTILQTPKNINSIRSMGAGLFHYFGMESEIKNTYKKYETFNTSMIIYNLHFNVDGLPIHKSNKNSFWPILCKISNYPLEPPFAVALYYGPGKPPLNEFFIEFLAEIKSLTENCIYIDGHRVIRIKCKAFCCDTPARSYIKATVGHNSYNGCDKCVGRGTFIKRRMAFLNTSAPLRSHENFVLQNYVNYHKGISPICEIEIDMISGFPSDYMHSVCLGVMRKVLFLWRDGSRLFRLNPEKRNLLEDRLKLLKDYWPEEFNRKPRSLKELEHWKAIEYRQFLLYLSPLLKDVLSHQIFNHFMFLKYAMTILLNDNLNLELNTYAGKLLLLFVRNFSRIYGKETCVYNVHSLIHLSADAKNFKSLNYANCFAFENYLGFMKRLLRKSHQCLQQVIHRIYEGRTIGNTAISNQNKIRLIGRPIKSRNPESNILYYSKFFYNNWTFSVNRGNNCAFLLNKEIIRINKIFLVNNVITIEGQKIDVIEPLLKYPADSTFMSLFKVKISDIIITEQIKNIKCKALLLPYFHEFVCSPLIHCI